MALSFRLDGKPEAQPRPSFGRNRNFYNPKSSKLKQTREILSKLVESLPGGTPVFGKRYLYVELIFHMPRPQCQLCKNGDQIVVRQSVLQTLKTMVPRKKVDADNLVKFILDAMTGPLYADDAQAIRLTVTKVMDNEGKCQGHTDVKIIEINSIDQLTSFV